MLVIKIEHSGVKNTCFYWKNTKIKINVIVTYVLDENNNCPTCQNLIHQSHPSQYVAFDRTMQDIVYKLVPGLQEQETIRRTEYHKNKRLERGEDSDDEEELGIPYMNGTGGLELRTNI